MAPPNAGTELVDKLRAGAHVIGRVVPAGYADYARIFPRADRGGSAIRWSDLISTPLRPTTNWAEIVATDRSESLIIPEGSLDGVTSSALSQALAASEEDLITFGLWDGYADSQPYLRYPSVILPPQRRTLLLRARPADASIPVGHLDSSRRLTQWWPDDLSWCVGSDIYSHSIALGGSADTIARVLDFPGLEAIRIGVSDEVTSLM